LAASGHTMVARWHLGPITGSHFWWVLLTSPEILVFLFFMLTDPKTSPTGGRARVVYAASVGLLAALLIAPLTTEWATKVAVLGTLRVWLVAGKGQSGPVAFAKVAGVRQVVTYAGKPPKVLGQTEPIALTETLQLALLGRHWSITGTETVRAPSGPPLRGYRLQN